MFGYPCAFVNGNMFAGLFQDRIFVRLSPDDRSGLDRTHGAIDFEPMPRRPMKAYAVVPDADAGVVFVVFKTPAGAAASLASAVSVLYQQIARELFERSLARVDSP